MTDREDMIPRGMYRAVVEQRNEAVAEVTRLLMVLLDITRMPLEGDYDYSPGISERQAARDALSGDGDVPA